MDTVYDIRPDTEATVAPTHTGRRTPGAARSRLEQELSPWLSPACTTRLWSDAWERAHVTPGSLCAWLWCFGEEMAALAVAAGLTEGEMRGHLNDRRPPNRGVLEMLADLNCFPWVTPAARPLTGH
jgi:hypothetical protein